MAFRVDLGSLRPAQRMPDGRVRVDAHITRAGIFRYLNPDGSIRLELRDPVDVFDGASIRSFEQLPVTNTHPAQMVTAANARQFMIGANGESVVRDDDHLRTQIMVADAGTIAEMDAGRLVQVSCGYTCDYDPTPGVHPTWGKYDGRQRNIRGNHIALVSNARAGETARVRMDAAERADYAAMITTETVLTSIVDGHQHSLDPTSKWMETSYATAEGSDHGHTHSWIRNADGTIALSVNEGHTHTVEGATVDLNLPGRADRATPVQSNPPRATEKPMTTSANDKTAIEQATKLLADEKVRADGLQLKINELNAALAAATTRADAAEGSLTTARERIVELEAGRLDHAKLDEANGKVTMLTAKVTELQARVDAAEDPKRTQEAAEKRANIMATVKAVCGDRFDATGISNRDLQIEVIGRLGKPVDKKESDAHIEARYHERVDNWAASERAIADIRRAANPNPEQPAKRADSAEDARRAMIERNQNAWKTPVAK